MKKLLAFMLSISMIASNVCFAYPPDFSGGVNNEYEYEEVVFLSGKPIKMTGQVKVKEKEKDDTKNVTYDIDISNEDEKAKLSRKVEFLTTIDKRADKGQTIETTKLDDFDEDFQIGNDKYELEDYQFSKSDVVDNRPASDFLSGNIKGRKVYKINKNEGTLTVDMTGADVGYENFWGNTSTYTINNTITCDRKKDDDDLSWTGSVKNTTSDSMNKVLKYSKNEANLSSFDGGHMRVTSEDMVSSYDYDMPKFDDDGEIQKGRRNSGTSKISRSMVPNIERLIVPKFRDLQGHWAQEYIEKLYSLDVFDDEGTFFGPDLPMNRMDFTKAVIRSCDIRTSLDDPKPKKPSKKDPKEVSAFDDMSVDDPNYPYVRSGVEKGIVKGENHMFKPDDSLTRAEAITILIRALGFENKAPSPGYYTTFSDDAQIPYWAKDSIYMAKQLGLVTGDEAGRINPNKVMTRAESSAMLVRFLEFLQKDLQKDYRENIIYFD